MEKTAEILIVEDDMDLLALLREWFTRAGYQVRTAPDAIQAVRQSMISPPDMIILDFAIPAGNGAEVLRRLRYVRAGRRMPVLVFTAMPEAEVAGCIGMDADVSYLRKPTPVAKLEAAVRRRLADPGARSVEDAACLVIDLSAAGEAFAA